MSVKNSRLRPLLASGRVDSPARPALQRRRPVAALVAAAALPILAATGCNSTESADQASNTVGSYVEGTNSSFFVDGNFGGLASSLRVAQQYYGRLVRIQAQAGPSSTDGRVTLHDDFVIDPRSEGAWNEDDYALETNPVTGEQVLFIKADYSDITMDLGELETGRQRFIRLLKAADAGTRVVADNGFGQAGTYTMVPRNAAFVVILDDLVDPDTLNASSVRVQVGAPAVTPFEARVFLDPNHGDTVNFGTGPRFYSSRVVIDPAISELDSFNSSTPISVNLLGFPGSVDSNQANVEVRFPTRQIIGQIQPVLQNLSNSPLTTAQNGSFDFSSPTREVVRAFRAGGRTDVTGDPGNGFLFDGTAPRVVGTRPAVITAQPVVEDAANLIFTLPEVQFATAVCDIDPRAGDLIAQAPFFARVLESSALSGQGIANNLRIQLIVTPEGFTGPAQYQASGQGPIAYRTAYDPVEDAALAFCFVETTPSAPDSDNPTINLSTDVEFTVRFNEAVDPGLLEAYEGIALLRKDPNLAGAGGAATILPTDYVPGTVTNDASLETFTFRPFQDLAHLFGNEESYFFQLQGGDFGPRDLAGNPVEAVPDVVEFILDTNRPDRLTGGRVIRFNSPDEEWPFGDPTGTFLDGLPRNEWFGNVDYDIVRGRIRPRSVVRSQVVVSQDPENTLVSQMFNGTGTSLPLNPLGARVQFVWRYLDVNLPLYTNRDIRNRVDMSSLDLDVERILLNPLGSTPVFEAFSEFSVEMSHSSRTPNEAVNAQQALTDPGSGLTSNFDGNQLSLVEDVPKLVSPRQRGYVINPGDRSVAADGTVLLPLAMNLNLPVEQWLTFTWRSTAIDARGGSSAVGAPVGRYGQLTGLQGFDPTPDPMGGPPDCNTPFTPNPMYDTGEVRTAALPLMVDVKCYPSNGTSSQNQFGHAWAHVQPGSNPAVTTNLPGFRAYSSGGTNQGGTLFIVDPDSQTVASGGFDPTSTPPGAPLPPVDNIVYYGALDLVTRVSRMHSIFYPAYNNSLGPDTTPQDIAGDATYSNPNYLAPLTVPSVQPQGTELQFEYRVSRAVAFPNEASETTWAFRMDPYGDFYDSTPINFTPQDEVPGVSIIGGASCVDGSFDYIIDNENPSVSGGFINGSDAWTPFLSEISGIEGDWIQIRVSFINNIATGQFPELSALGLSWAQN